MARGAKKAAVEAGPVEGPWELPDGWRWERLGALADFVNGAAFKPTDWHQDGVPIIRIQNLTNPLRAPNRTRRQVDEKFRVCEGDILVSWSATLDVFTWRGHDAWLNQHIFKVCNIREGIEKRYLLHLLKSEVDVLRRSEHLHGSTMLHINRGPFLAHPVPLPDLEAQRRIVARIDELFDEIDDGERHMHLAFAAMNVYRPALLNTAVNGGLPAVERPSDPVIDQAEAAEEWPTEALGALLLDGPQNGLYMPQSAYGAGVPIFRIDDFQAGSARPATALRRVEVSPGVAATYALRPGDIVLNRVNSRSHLGKAFLVRDQHAPALFESNMMRFRLREDMHPAFVEMFLRSGRGRAELTKNAKDAVNQASINQKDVQNTRVPTPPLAQQLEIVEAVALREQEADVLSECLAAASAGASALRQSILAAAFRGDLVA